VDKAKQDFSLDKTQIETVLKSVTSGTLREVFLSKLEFGPALFAHVLRSVDLTPQTKIAGLIDSDTNLQ
jgi:hypothetical protein